MEKSGLSVAGLLVHLNVQAPRIAVELNTNIVSKAAYDKTLLQDGDAVEIVAFVGGG